MSKALQLLGSGDGQTACKDALVRVGAVTVLAAQLVAEGPLTQVMPAAPAACWMHLSPASLEVSATCLGSAATSGFGGFLSFHPLIVFTDIMLTYLVAQTQILHAMHRT